MTDWRSLVEKDHLGAWDLVAEDGNTPKDYTLKIAKVEGVALKTRESPKGKRKPVITFERAKKKFVVNTTNGETIESLYGKHFEAWVGKLITLYQTDVRNPKGGPMIKGIRVRPKRPSGQAEEIKERPVDQEIRDAQHEAFDRNDGAPGREPGED